MRTINYFSLAFIFTLNGCSTDSTVIVGTQDINGLSIPDFTYTCNYFIDSEVGDDANDGTSQESAWKSAAKATEHSRLTGYVAGDAICFKRGQRFIVLNPTLGGGSSGSEGNYIVFGAYGDDLDPRPVLSPSLNITSLADWASQVSTIVRTPNEWADQGGGVFLWQNDHVSWSPSKVWRGTDFLDEASDSTLGDGDWFFERGTGLYFKPADGLNPSTQSTPVYLDIKNSVFGAHQSSNLVFADLALEYAGNGIVNSVFASGDSTGGVSITNFAVVNSTFNNMNIPVEVRSRTEGSLYHEPSKLYFIENTMTDIGSYGIRLESANLQSGFSDIYIIDNVITNVAIGGDHLPANPSDIEAIGLQNASDVYIIGNSVVNGLKESDGIGVRSTDGKSFHTSGIIVWRHPDVVLRNLEIAGNFVSNVASGVVIGSGPFDMNRDITIYNNIVAESEKGIKLFGVDSTNGSQLMHNTIYRNGINVEMSPYKGFGMVGNLSVDPVDYHLVINSFEGVSEGDFNAYYPDGPLFKADNNNAALVTVFDNLADWKTAFSIDPDANSVTGENAGFINGAPNESVDFKLSATSTALGLIPGDATTIGVDFSGNTRLGSPFKDAGAWEQ